MTIAGFITLALDLLLLFMCFIGLIVAIIRWKKHPAVSIITILSLLLTAAGSIGLFCFWFYYFELEQGKILVSDDENIYYTLSLSFHGSSILLLFLISILQTVLVPLFLAGIFIGRGKSGKIESNSG